MYAIKAVYDGAKIMPLEPIPVKEKYNVVITFIEPTKNNPTPSFESQISHENDKRRVAFGYLKGKIHVPDDFNAPLDDFEEYM